jgi:SAM-dependent methyltransferase
MRRASGALGRLVDRLTELRYRVDTDDLVYHEDLGLESDDRVWHDPSNWAAPRRALDALGVTSDDVFADVGSGLGRAVVLASGYPFRRVIGVEVADSLTRRARENLARSRRPRRCGAVELVTADALEWAIPADLTVLYLYCPFTGDVFTRFLERLLASVDTNPRPLRLVYNYPVEHNRLIRTGRVVPLAVVPGRWPARSAPTDVIVTYLVLPSDAQLAAEYSARFPARLQNAPQWQNEYEPGFSLQKPDRLGGVVLDRRDTDSGAP